MYFNNEGELMSTKGWIMTPVFKLLSNMNASVNEYPNIQVWEDFTAWIARRVVIAEFWSRLRDGKE
jgi:hypothetical protein